MTTNPRAHAAGSDATQAATGGGTALDQLLRQLPEWANDARLNLRALLAAPELTAQQLWGTALAAAAATRSRQVLAAIAAEAKGRLTPTAFRAALAAAAAMSMNNVYYRFVHLATNREYAAMPARLRMQALARPGVEAVDFELWSLAVSAVNGCGACIDGHERQLRAKGASAAAIQATVKLAAVVHAVAVSIDAAAALDQAAAA